MINLVHLRSLFGNDEGLVNRFISIFKMQIPQQLQTLREALDQQAWEDATLAAHSIKSLCQYFELEAVAACCQQIEDQPTKKGHLFPEVEEQLANVLATL